MKYSAYLALAAAAFLTASCDYNEQFDGFVKGPQPTDVKKIEYTLTAADYKAIAENKANLALCTTKTDSAALKALAKTQQFTETVTAAKFLPAFLAEKWFTADDNSAVVVNYNRREVKGPLDFKEDFEGTGAQSTQPAVVKGWTTLTPLGGDKAVWSTGFYNNAHYVQATANKQPDSTQTYLLTPHFTVTKGSHLTFDALYGYYKAEGGRLSVFVVDDNMNNASIEHHLIENLTAKVKIEVPAAGQKYGTFKQALDVDLSKYAGRNIGLAFRYDGNGRTGATTTVQLDNVQVGNQTIDETPGKDQFVRNNGKWVYNPSSLIELKAEKGNALTTAYMQAGVDWVKEHVDAPLGVAAGAGYVSKYGNNEVYSGLSAYYGNVDLRPSAARTQYAKEYASMSDAEITAKMAERLQQTLGAALTKLNPEAVPVAGLDVIYTLRFGVYDGNATKTYEMKFKVVGKGQFEYVKDSYKAL